MKGISRTTELRDAIELLEAEQADKLKLMKEKFHVAYDSIKPVNLIESTLRDISASPHLLNNLISTTLGLLSGYLSKKVVTGRSNKKLRKFLGIVIQFGITNLIAKNPKAVKSIGQYISQHIFHKEK